MEDVSFGEWLKRQRGAMGWTQQQLAHQINCSLSAVRKIESEERRPSADITKQLAEIFDVPQNQYKSFLSFARGDWQAFFSREESENAPWQGSRVAFRSNLPASITSFIGRAKEQDQIINLLSKNRLVTLAGVGGIGKTSLSLQVGQKLLKEYPNGVWFITLDSLSDPALVPQTVAALFDIRETPDRPVIEILTSALREKTALLILDNCEHLLESCARLITLLLQNCPKVKILVTSREVLNVTGEAIYQIPSLSIPAQDEASLAKLTEYESIRLFTDRASLALSSFVLTKDNAQAMIDICRKVEGVPLAIELAAAHVNILQVTEILNQLQNSFALLSTDKRAASSHHKTLQVSLDWSWGLLNEAEQMFMRQLAVFAGGWTLESVQAVCDGDVLGLTDALVQKSLIRVKQEAGRMTRYRFHEIVRQYALEKLTEAGEAENVRIEHLKYFLKLSGQIEPGLHGPLQVEWLARASDERDNLRAALEQAAKTDVEAGLYMSGRLEDFWASSDIREGVQWLEAFTGQSGSKDFPRARARALLAQGQLRIWFQQFAPALSAAQECLKLFRSCRDQQGEVDALILLGNVTQFQGRVGDGWEFFQQALSLAEALDDKWRQARVLFYSGSDLRDRKRSFAYWEKAVGLFRQVGDSSSLADLLDMLALSHVLNGEIDVGQKYLDEAALLWSLHRKPNILEPAKTTRSTIALMRGDYELAHSLLQEVAVFSEASGNRMDYLWASVRLGYVSLRAGNLTEARHIFVSSVETFQKDQYIIGVVFALEGMESLYVAVGKPEIAARLIGWADATREKIDDIRPPIEQADVDRDIAAIITKIGNSVYEEEYDKGRAMTMDEAVLYALGES